MHSPFKHSSTPISRASIILTILFLATLSTAYAATDSGIRSGELSAFLIEPTKQAYNSFVAELEQSMLESTEAERARKSADSPQQRTQATVKNQVIITNDSATGSAVQQRTTYQQQPVQNTLSNPSPSSQPVIQNQTKTWEQIKAENDAWFEEQKALNQQKYEDSVNNNQEWLESERLKSQQELEEFRKEAEAKQEAFRQENGF